MNFLITGATGNLGARITDLLIQRGERPRVYVRDEAKARSRFGDGVDVFVGDLGDSTSLQKALEGVDVFFLLTKGPEIPQLDTLAAKAAQDAGVGHLVKLSSMDVAQSLATGAWHGRGEAAIRESGVPFTFVRPTGFMSNLLAWAHSIKSEGVVRSSAGRDGLMAFLHPDDIAAVSVKVMTERGHLGESLPITGPEALSYAEVTRRIGTAIGRELCFEELSDEEARQRYARFSASEEETEAHVKLWRAIREGRLGEVTDGVEKVLGRAPLNLEVWLRENATAFRV